MPVHNIRTYNICREVLIVHTFTADVVVEELCPGQHHAVDTDCMFDEVGTACRGVGQQLHTAKVLYEVCLKAESLKDKQTLRGITRALSRQRGGKGDQEAVHTVLLVKMCIINQTKEGGVAFDVYVGSINSISTSESRK